MSVQVSTEIIAISMLVLTFFAVVTAAALIWLAFTAAKAVKSLTQKAQPLISRANETAKTASEMAQTVKARTEKILGTAEGTVEDVARRVKTTTNIVQESISPPMITVASVLTGVSKGMEVLSHMKRRGGNGHGQ